MQELNLIAYLSSRLCHDLVGPIGALANGVEILADEDDPEMRKQATELLAASAIEASRRLQYFRMAFGALGGLGDQMATGEVRRAAMNFFESGRAQLKWAPSVALPAELAKNHAKLLLNLLLVAQSMLPRGGQIEIGVTGPEEFAILAAGTGARIEPPVARALTDQLSLAELDSHNAIAAYAARLAATLGGRLEVGAAADGEVAIRFVRG